MVTIPRLYLKLFRDIKEARLQFGAVIFIIVLGIAMFVGSYGAYLNLQISYDITFNQLDMADYWISVDQVSQVAVREIDNLPGVKATGRVIGEVSIDLNNDSGEKVTARVISLPIDNPPDINSVNVEQGSYFQMASNREVLVEKRFADYHRFIPGDWLTIQKNGYKANYRVAGIVTSPEFIWVAKNERETMPSPRTFGIIFMPQPVTESLFEMEGRVNEITLLISPGIDHDMVITEVKQILHSNYISRITAKDDPTVIRTRKLDIIEKVRSAYLVARKDQVSNRLLRQDLDSFASIAILFPLLFLSMASLTIYVLMNRMIESQRMQIGIMRAIGYSKLMVLSHYTGFGLFVGIAGSLLGVLAGHFMANGWTMLYVDQLNMPFAIIKTHWDIMLTGMLIGVVVPLLAGLIPAWSALRIKPVEAMRPPIPVTGNRIILRLTEILLRWLPYTLKLPLRNIVRNIKRSFFMALGVISTILLVLVAMSFVDALERILYVQYNIIESYDARLIFQGTGTASTANYVSHFNGITGAEPVLEVPYRIRYGGAVIDTSIMGIQENSSMYRLITQDGSRIEVIQSGILVPNSFKDRLGVQLGDVVHLEPIVGVVGQTEKAIAGFVDIPIGARSFMPISEVQKLVREPGTATSVFLKFNGEHSNELLKRLYDLPQVATVELSSDTRGLINEQMGFFWVFIGAMLIMGGALGTAIIFNGVTVNVLQRTREIAIMRALGIGRAGLAFMLSLENLAIGCAGIILGIPIGRILAQAFFDSMMTSTEDLFSFNLVIYPRSYVIAVAFTLLILFVSQVPAIRHVSRLSLATATKEWAE
jgi:putative ABC transport system permease protein